MVLDNFDDLTTKHWTRLEHKLASLSETHEELRILLSYTKSSGNTFNTFLERKKSEPPKFNKNAKQEITYQDTPFPEIKLKSLDKK